MEGSGEAEMGAGGCRASIIITLNIQESVLQLAVHAIMTGRHI